MSESDITRMIAIDPRAKNPKAIELHTNAEFFLRDAQSLKQVQSAGQFLLCMHAIELALKAFLHNNSCDLENLRIEFGHDLDKLLTEALNQGLTLSQNDTSQIVSNLNKYVYRAAIRYEFSFRLPMINDVLRVVKGLIDDTKIPLPS